MLTQALLKFSTVFAAFAILGSVEGLPANGNTELGKRDGYWAPSPITPNAATTWTIGTYQEVTWDASIVPDGTETVPWIDLYTTTSYGSAQYVTTLAQNVDAHAGRATVQVPDEAPGSYFVMAGAWGQSSAEFQIVAPPYIPHILTPNSDTVWTIGATETITWDTSSLPDHVGHIPQFQLWTDSSYGSGIFVTTLVSDVDATVGSVSVTVPSDIAPGTYFIVVIYGDNSSFQFQIVAA